MAKKNILKKMINQLTMLEEKMKVEAKEKEEALKLEQKLSDTKEKKEFNFLEFAFSCAINLNWKPTEKLPERPQQVYHFNAASGSVAAPVAAVVMAPNVRQRKVAESKAKNAGKPVGVSKPLGRPPKANKRKRSVESDEDFSVLRQKSRRNTSSDENSPDFPSWRQKSRRRKIPKVYVPPVLIYKTEYEIFQEKKTLDKSIRRSSRQSIQATENSNVLIEIVGRTNHEIIEAEEFAFYLGLQRS